MIDRILQINALLEKNKVLIIYGPRQVGKTTLVKQFLADTKLKFQYFTGDQLDFATDFSKCDLNLIKKMLGDANLLVIDEAQKIENIGRALKPVIDNINDIYVIVTGSSSFELANHAAESLTGRKNIVTLYPVSLKELSNYYTPYQIDKNLADYLIYGTYPNIITYGDYSRKQNRIIEIKDSYLIKDILEFHKVKSAKTVIDLLRLLAFQIGGLVSTTELGKSLGVDNKTVLRYLDLLEKAFVIYRLSGLSRNPRSEISKMNKYYFYDLGIRNALIANFNALSLRNDVGQLWENLMVIERIKQSIYSQKYANYYFWRTYENKEIDLVEEVNGKLSGFEFKWQKDKVKQPLEWSKSYPGASYQVITSNSYQEFVGI